VNKSERRERETVSGNQDYTMIVMDQRTENYVTVGNRQRSCFMVRRFAGTVSVKTET
jgi:hypothetical protein